MRTCQKPIVVFKAIVSVIGCAGCAGLDFGKEGLSYYETTPYLFVSVNKECIATATTVSLPGEKKSVKFDRGYGSADLSVTLSNGMITAAGQKTDSKIPETITSIASLETALSAMSTSNKPAQTTCIPSAVLYRTRNGVPDLESPFEFPIKTQTVTGNK